MLKLSHFTIRKREDPDSIPRPIEGDLANCAIPTTLVCVLTIYLNVKLSHFTIRKREDKDSIPRHIDRRTGGAGGKANAFHVVDPGSILGLYLF